MYSANLLQPNEIRQATHAGSWYDGNRDKLDKKINGWLSNATKELKNIKAKAVIGPHAGYAYCGATSAWGYSYIEPKKDLIVFLFGPSHRAYFEGCLLSSLKQYETPFGNIDVDLTIINELLQTKQFKQSSKKVEENEHSLEMHLPFIYKMLNSQKFKLVPIMVGNVGEDEEIAYGKIFAKYLARDDTLFCISTDFCHWGDNFDYKPYDKSAGKIYQYIEKLDKQGATLIEQHNPVEFRKYIEKTKNTICGRNPISIFLNALVESGLNTKLKTKLCQYSQSGQVEDMNDSSVSYASMVTYSQE